jgi:uncharacterized protein YfaP (DUF2135 family)
LNTLLIAGIAGLCFASSAASASVVFLNGNNPQPGEENVLFGTNQTGTTVSGFTNQSNIQVNFTSTTAQTLIASALGQAQVTTANNGGFITSIVMTSPGHVFQDIIANPHNSGAFTVTAVTNDGTFSQNFAGGTGNNFVTVLAQNGETISSVSFTSTAGFDQFQQPRISGLASAIPEPSTWAMMLLGFAGLGFAFRQSRRKVSFG